MIAVRSCASCPRIRAARDQGVDRIELPLEFGDVAYITARSRIPGARVVEMLLQGEPSASELLIQRLASPEFRCELPSELGWIFLGGKVGKRVGARGICRRKRGRREPIRFPLSPCP